MTNDPTSHKSLSEFLNSKSFVHKKLSETELNQEKIRLISTVIRRLSYQRKTSVSEIYQELDSSGAIDYLIENWSIIHTFDIRKVIEEVELICQRTRGKL